MSVGNKYTLRIHHNFLYALDQTEKFPFNNSLDYNVLDNPKTGKDYYLMALYDEGFFGNYVANRNSQVGVSLYGSLTADGCYFFVANNRGFDLRFFYCLSRKNKSFIKRFT